MTAANAPAHASTSSPLTPRTILAAWRGITPAQVAMTVALGCVHVLYVRIVFVPWDEWTNSSLLLEFAHEQFHVFPMLLAFVVADRVTGKDPNRRGGYALAVVVFGANSHTNCPCHCESRDARIAPAAAPTTTASA